MNAPNARTSRWLSMSVAVVVVLAVVAFRRPLGAWFGVRDTAAERGTSVGTHEPGASLKSTGAAAAGASSDGGDPDAVDHYTCSMHPSVKQSGPGKCPICGMDLIAVTKAQQEQGVVTVDETRRQLIGVRTAKVTLAPFRTSFRAVGHVGYDESALTDVSLKVRGWITKLYVNRTGQRVARGQALFTVYSPDLYSAQQDFLLASRGGAPGVTADGGSRLEGLARAARQRLRLLGLADAELDTLATRSTPLESVAFPSPASGFIIEKDIVEGAAVEPGMRLFRIAALNRVWVEADVYEADFPNVRVDQHADVTLDYVQGRSYAAKVGYVYPYLDPKTRTGRVRIELQNNDLELRPGMFASVALTADLGTRLQVPAAAVVYTGTRRLVFVDLGEGRFKPQEVDVGVEANGMFEVRSGLHSDDVLAVSGVFLIAAEARISTAAKYWESSGEDAGAVVLAPPAVSSLLPSALPPRTRGAPSPPPSPRATVPTAAPPAAASYTCPMHPEVQSATPGKCPKCGMDLVPSGNGP